MITYPLIVVTAFRAPRSRGRRSSNVTSSKPGRFLPAAIVTKAISSVSSKSPSDVRSAGSSCPAAGSRDGSAASFGEASESAVSGVHTAAFCWTTSPNGHTGI